MLTAVQGANVACFAYDAGLSTWTAFFKLPEGGFRTVGKIASEDECKRYIGAFKDGIPTACRQLAMPVTCNVACVTPMPPPSRPPEVTPQAVPEPDPKPAPPDPAASKPSYMDATKRPATAMLQRSDHVIQVDGRQYTKVAGLTWVERESTRPDLFADVSVGPNDLQSKDQPSPLKTAEAPKKRVVVAPHYYYYRAPRPLQALIDTVMLPFDFLSYPGRRDW